MRARRMALFLLVVIVGCASLPSRFPLRKPMAIDTGDFQTFLPMPSEYLAATIWDGVDESLLHPLSELFSFHGDTHAVDVNALDEVPNSSWFTNRSPEQLKPEAMARGACKEPLDPEGPFEIISGKPDGWNPGFFIQAKNGNRYFFKFDQHELQPERMSMAEVVGSLLYHSIGFSVPCYEIVYFKRSALIRPPTATMKNKKGEKVPMDEAFVNEAFRLAKFTEDGRVRAVASLLLEGKPLGPWRYDGTTDDDPNDVIPHEDRREVRAGYVIASWISHFDTRDQNTLRNWIAEKKGGPGYVRHNLLDFGDSLGNLTDADALSRRLGYSYYFDFPYFLADFFTLGLIERPWDKVNYGPGGAVLGYYDVENFDPERWHPGYHNPAFNRLTELDAAWMARRIAEFRNEHLQAIVEKARLQNQVVKKQLLDTLIGRRDKLLARWFHRYSPLTEPDVKKDKEGLRLCLRDLLRFSRLAGEKDRTYAAHLIEAGPEIALPMTAEAGDQACLQIPASYLPADRYLTLRLGGHSPQNPDERPLRLHVGQIEGTWQAIGLERQ